MKERDTISSKISEREGGEASNIGNSQNNIDDKGYWDNVCSRHMTGNISYLSDYEPYDGGYVSFGHGGEKITVVTDDFSRFTWTFFLRTKDETSSILRNFITKIENLKDLKKDIRREFSNARTLQQNGVAERRNRTLIEAARTMLADAKIPVTFWAEAVNTTCYVQNRVLVNKSQNKTPYELFNSRIPAIRFLRPFGCHVMILNTLDRLRKFDAKGDEGYFVGYSLSSKAFRVFNKRTKKVEENLHVDFLENKLIEKGDVPSWLFNIDTLTNSMNYVPVVVVGTSSTNILAHMKTSNDTIRNSDAQYDSQKEQDCNADAFEDSGISNPTTTSKVPSADHMEPAVSLTVESKILTVSSPVPTVFLDISPEIQEEGIYYEEVFAPVARIETIRLFLAYASLIGFIVYQMDVKSIFLYGTIDDEVYVMQPPGFQDPEFLERLYKVEKAMYGLHQAPRAWYERRILLVQVYVDDIIFGSSNPQLCREFEALMHDKFQMSAMSELNFFLRLQVLQKKNGIFLSQDKYVGDILKKFGYSDVRSMIGSLMYLTASRPDIMFAFCACARHQVTPKECHLHVVKRIFRYLKGHPNLGLWYPKESPFDLVAYSDSDYGGAIQDRKSTTGGCQFLGRRLILWQRKKQTIVATSTTEAEYVAAASGCGQVLWIQNQTLEYGYNFMNTKIYIDNNSAICIVKNPVYHSKTKHIEIRHHFIRDCYEKKLINVNHIHTDDNLADLLTKPFDVGRFQYLVMSIGMIDP
nr:putative ribonuclease H-like domain-containing protein [Tanacetum cinerariifolium]